MAKILAIDEISMFRSDIMDYLDQVLKNIRESSSPFGGSQFILIGDFFSYLLFLKKEKNLKQVIFVLIAEPGRI